MEYVIPFIEIIYRKKLEQHKQLNEIYFNKSIELKNQTQINSKWFCDTFNTLNSNYNMLNDIFFQKLIVDITNEVKFFSKQNPKL